MCATKKQTAVCQSEHPAYANKQSTAPQWIGCNTPSRRNRTYWIQPNRRLRNSGSTSPTTSTSKQLWHKVERMTKHQRAIWSSRTLATTCGTLTPTCPYFLSPMPSFIVRHVCLFVPRPAPHAKYKGETAQGRAACPRAKQNTTKADKNRAN